MSRSIKGGRDHRLSSEYWGKRIGNNGGSHGVRGKETKRLTHRRERAQESRLLHKLANLE